MVQGTGVFKMDVDCNNKIFTAFAEGFFSLEQGGNFCEEFIKTSKELSKDGNYALIVDVKEVKPSSPEVAEALANALALYVSDDFKFKSRFMTRLSSAVAQSQITRLSKGIEGFSSKMTFVDTKEEALRVIKGIDK